MLKILSVSNLLHIEFRVQRLYGFSKLQFFLMKYWLYYHTWNSGVLKHQILGTFSLPVEKEHWSFSYKNATFSLRVTHSLNNKWFQFCSPTYLWNSPHFIAMVCSTRYHIALLSRDQLPKVLPWAPLLCKIFG